MAILSVGELALLLGDSYDTFEDFMFSEDGARMKYRWDRYDNFDLSPGKRVRSEFAAMVSVGIVKQADYDNVIAESDKRDGKKLIPLEVKPIAELFDVKDGKGYIITSQGSKIKQTYAPALGGNYVMSESQASILSRFIVEKMYVGLSSHVSHYQITSLWEARKDIEDLINEEINSV